MTTSAIRRLYTVVVFIVLASLDNVAIGLVPPLYQPIAQDLGVRESAIGFATAVTFLVSAVAAVGWAYVGDRGNRKPILMAGTMIWALGTAGTALANGYVTFVGAAIIGSIGLGAVGSVGFSVVSDLIPPRRRGLVMSLFGLSQGVGMLVGTLLGGLLGGADWRRPFWVITVIGLVATIAYWFTLDIRRGQSEPELAGLYRAGGEYTPRIGRADLPRILARRTNVWLILQGVTAQVTFGSLVWLPRLFSERAQAQGYSAPTAIAIGSLYATMFQLGGVLSIVGGLVGDRVQRRVPGGRALVAAVGVLAGIPLYVVLFFVPLTVHVSDGASTGAVAAAVLGSLFTEPTVTVSFLAALLALALTSANAPNWFALIADVNPPEHRGSVYSMGNLANGVGRASGNALVGVVFRTLATRYPPPLNFALGLALFQAFFIPTGIMYYLASRTAGRDIAAVRARLRESGAGSAEVGPTNIEPAPERAASKPE
jgi:MFS family permease